MTPTPWSKKLRAHRKRLGLTQVAMAARFDLTASTLIAWENGQRTPSVFTQKYLLGRFRKIRLTFA